MERIDIEEEYNADIFMTVDAGVFGRPMKRNICCN